MAKKKASKKSSSTGPVLKDTKPQKSDLTTPCLRWVDKNTYVVSNDQSLRPVVATEMTKIPEGCVKLDNNTIVKI